MARQNSVAVDKTAAQERGSYGKSKSISDTQEHYLFNETLRY